MTSFAPVRAARLLLEAASRTAAFNPDQARDERGRWTDQGSDSAGESGANADAEATIQQRLSDAQTNPLAHPTMVIGGSNAPEVLRYVAAYGEEHKAAPLPDGVQRGIPKECYKNASLLVLERSDLTYAEGFAQVGSLPGLTFQHAWAVTKDGTVVDPTWDDPENSKYFGVRYERKAYLQYLYKAKLYGVLGSTTRNAREAVRTGARKLRG
jgi:hypothetical protein